MFKLNIENIQKLATKAYLSHVEAAFGQAGTEGIRILLDAVKLIFQRCPPEKLSGTLTVLCGIGTTSLTPVTATLGSPERCKDYGEVGSFLVNAPSSHHIFVELMPDSSFSVLSLATDADLAYLAQSAVVYRFDGNADRILAKGYDDFVPPVSPILVSNFAVPTFHILEEALKYYGEYALESKCRILKDVWEGGVDGPRLVLVNKPEARMRDSLVQVLEIILRDVTVKPEQNTDETKPVDIRINWFASGATALIEVKWLGKATAKSLKQGSGPTYTEYGSSRAQSGANQLADYMDREVRHSNATAPRGYLVIFDARRRDTKGPSDNLTAADAMAFANDVLSFDPDHSKIRDDFAEPVRFFLRPRKSHFLAS